MKANANPTSNVEICLCVKPLVRLMQPKNMKKPLANTSATNISITFHILICIPETSNIYFFLVSVYNFAIYYKENKTQKNILAYIHFL